MTMGVADLLYELYQGTGQPAYSSNNCFLQSREERFSLFRVGEEDRHRVRYAHFLQGEGGV